MELGLYNQIRDVLQKWSFEIIATKILNPEEKVYCANRIRGGNWGKGPFPQSGGKPAMTIVALDKSPVEPSQNILKSHPGLTNQKVLTVTEHLRNLANSSLHNKHKCNVIHSSDNEEHALEYIRLLLPEKAEKLYQYVEQRNMS